MTWAPGKNLMDWRQVLEQRKEIAAALRREGRICQAEYERRLRVIAQEQRK